MTTKYDIGDRLFIECEIENVYFRKDGNHKYIVRPIVDDYLADSFHIMEDKIQFIVDTPEDDTETKFVKLKRKLIELGRKIIDK